MSVLVSKSPVERHRDKFIYVKGAPETIKKLSQPETIPADFNEALSSLTQKGYRVLAMGHKRLRMNIHKADRLERYISKQISNNPVLLCYTYCILGIL